MRCRPQIARIIFLGGAQAATESLRIPTLSCPGFVVFCVRTHFGLTWIGFGSIVVTAVVKVLYRPGMHRSSATSRREQEWAVVKSVWQSIVFWFPGVGPCLGDLWA